MKKTMKKMLASAMAAMMMIFAGNMMTAFGAETYAGKGNADDAVYKNTITVDTVTLTESEAQAIINDNGYVEVNVVLGSEGTGSIFNAFGLSFYYTDELTVVKTRKGNFAWTVNTLTDDYGMTVVESSLGEEDGMIGRFLCSCASEIGIEDQGALFTFRYQLPENVNVGDFYPVNIAYRSGDKFTFGKGAMDYELAEQAWTFTNGLASGGIQIVADPEPEPETDENVITPETKGNINGDGALDSSDSALILKSYATIQSGNKEVLTPEQYEIADFNSDGSVDSSDAALVLQAYAKAQSAQ